ERVAFEVERAALGRVLGEDPGPRALADPPPGALGGAADDRRALLGAARDHDLLAGLEDRLEPGPRIADDRNAAGRGFEEPHGGAPAGPHHRRARHVERPALRVVEAAMLARRKMLDPLDIDGPVDPLRVLRPGNYEPAAWPGARRDEE